MQLSEDKADNLYKINSYGAGFIRVNNVDYTHSLVISQDFFCDHWPPKSIQELNEAHLQLLFDHQPALIIIGSGPKLVHPSGPLLQLFYQRKIGFEIMDTPAACRTLTLLLAEKRNVIAGLIL